MVCCLTIVQKRVQVFRALGALIGLCSTKTLFLARRGSEFKLPSFQLSLEVLLSHKIVESRPAHYLASAHQYVGTSKKHSVELSMKCPLKLTAWPAFVCSTIQNLSAVKAFKWQHTGSSSPSLTNQQIPGSHVLEHRHEFLHRCIPRR